MPPPAAGGGDKPAAKQKDGDAELLAGFNGMFKLMAKMSEAKPDLKEGFDAAKDIFKKQITDVFKRNPDEVMNPPDSAAATPPGGASPQGVPPAPESTPGAERVPA